MAKFLTKEEKKALVTCISETEMLIEGEIKVHLEEKCIGAVNLRAFEIFQGLELYKTKNRIGVLIYVAVKDQKIAIIGDEGIHKVVPDNFWDSTLDGIISYLKKGDNLSALEYGIKEVGRKLQEFFPSTDDNKNELSNELSIADDFEN
jgi:uncharacterized membrane protein